MDFLLGIMSYLGDNPQRRVRMAYEVDDSYVAPTELGVRMAQDIYDGLKSLDISDGEYDYFDYWEEAKRED